MADLLALSTGIIEGSSLTLASSCVAADVAIMAQSPMRNIFATPSRGRQANNLIDL